MLTRVHCIVHETVEENFFIGQYRAASASGLHALSYFPFHGRLKLLKTLDNINLFLHNLFLLGNVIDLIYILTDKVTDTVSVFSSSYQQI